MIELHLSYITAALVWSTFGNPLSCVTWHQWWQRHLCGHFVVKITSHTKTAKLIRIPYFLSSLLTGQDNKGHMWDIFDEIVSWQSLTDRQSAEQLYIFGDIAQLKCDREKQFKTRSVICSYYHCCWMVHWCGGKNGAQPGKGFPLIILARLYWWHS